MSSPKYPRHKRKEAPSLLLDVYDFDHTLYDGDTIIDFWRFSVSRHPAILRFLPRQVWALLMYALRRWPFDRVKGELQCYFAALDLEKEAEAYWQTPWVERKLYDWPRGTPTDLPRVIASASVTPLLLPVADRLLIDAVVGTEVDPATGRLLSPNCKHREKVAAIERRFPGFSVRAMYTDDRKADGPLLAMARERYLVEKGKVRRLA